MMSMDVERPSREPRPRPATAPWAGPLHILVSFLHVVVQGDLVMSSRKTWGASLLVLAVASSPKVWAQIPATGAAAGGAPSAATAGLGAAGTGAATPATAAAPQSLFGFFGLSSANIHKCIAKLCNTQLGQTANSLITGPVGSISGGFIPPLCPPVPTPAQIAAMQAMAPGGAEATAAKIKASEADAKARVAAVEYLGTVDCSRWKEATKALVNALRADTNECVRYAAARVLNSGCCCNKNTIEALKICVAGEDKDGNPPETSCRVKGAAFSALQYCLMKVPEVLPREEVKPIERERGSVPNLEPLPGPKPLGRERSTMNDGKDIHLAGSLSVAEMAVPRFDEQLERKSLAQTVSEARQTLFDVSRTSRPPATLPPGKRSVLNALIKARQDISTKARPAPPAAPAPSDPGVVPSSYNPSSGDSQGVAIPAPASGAGPMSAVVNPDSAPDPVSPPAGSKRGLIGLLLNSRKQGTDQ